MTAQRRRRTTVVLPICGVFEMEDGHIKAWREYSTWDRPGPRTARPDARQRRPFVGPSLYPLPRAKVGLGALKRGLDPAPGVVRRGGRRRGRWVARVLDQGREITDGRVEWGAVAPAAGRRGRRGGGGGGRPGVAVAGGARGAGGAARPRGGAVRTGGGGV